MEDGLFHKLRAVVSRIANRRDRVVYDTHTIVLVGLWAIVKDGPFSWACEPTHWPDRLRPRDLPDQTTLSRRWRRPELREALRRLNEPLLQQFGPLDRDAAVDGRPFVWVARARIRMPNPVGP